MKNAFYERFTADLSKNKLSLQNKSILVAVSGGIDSVVLLNILTKFQKKWNLKLSVAHVNYKLRNKESEKDAQFVGKLAKKYNLPFFLREIDTKKVKKNTNLQEFARNFRYRFFSELKKELNYDLIAVAHNANDNAETILLNLFRGTGISGLCGIPFYRKDIDVFRPLLFATRTEIVSFAKKNKLQWRDDSSNNTTKYKRNFLRNVLIPTIEKQINPSIIQRLNSEAVVFTQLGEFLETFADRNYKKIVVKKDGDIVVNVNSFLKQQQLIQELITKKILLSISIEPSFHKISALKNAAENQSGKIIELSKDWKAIKSSETITISRRIDEHQFCYTVKKEGRIKAKDFVFSIRKTALPKNFARKDSFTEFIDAESVKFPITIRSWNSGDVFIPLGMQKEKKLSDFFVDKKIPLFQKNKIPIVESQHYICWVAGLRIDERCKITKKTKSVYKLTIEYFNEEKKSYR